MILSLILAADENNAIGKDNGLPWHLPADLKYFKKITTGHTMIMGRRTWESIGRPLPNRTSIVVTRQEDYEAEGAIVKHSLDAALGYAREHGEEEAFVIGGAELLKAALPKADRFYLTRIHHTFEADTFLPEISEGKWEIVSEEHHEPDEKNKWPYTFLVLERK